MTEAIHHQIKPLRFDTAYQITALAVLITWTSSHCQANQKECSQIRVSGFPNWVPVAYINPETNKPEGLGYELTKQLGKKFDIPIRFNPQYPWPRVMEMTRSGELDLIAGAVPNPERNKFLYFTAPFFQGSQYAYTLKNHNMRLTKLEDLFNYQRSALRHSTLGTELDTRLLPTTTWVNNEQQMLSLVLSKRADYFLASTNEIVLMKTKYADLRQIRQLPLPIKTQRVMLAVSKKSPCVKYLKEFNRFIVEKFPDI
jgi:ABC-type amino acid transport substrate-binding protein